MKKYVKEIKKMIKDAQIEEFYKESDELVIKELARLLEYRDLLQSQIDEYGVVLVNNNTKGQTTYVSNPAIVQMDKCQAQIRQYLVQLYLTPKSRDEKFKKEQKIVKVKTHDDIINDLLSGLDI